MEIYFGCNDFKHGFAFKSPFFERERERDTKIFIDNVILISETCFKIIHQGWG